MGSHSPSIILSNACIVTTHASGDGIGVVSEYCEGQKGTSSVVLF